MVLRTSDFPTSLIRHRRDKIPTKNTLPPLKMVINPTNLAKTTRVCQFLSTYLRTALNLD